MNVLLIVDIQKSMGNWFPWSYISKVDKFIRDNRSNYDAVFMLMEPSFAVNEKGRILLPYSVGADTVPLFLINSLTHQPLYKAYNDGFWDQAEKNGSTYNSYFVNLPSRYATVSPYKMYVNQGLRTLITSLKDATSVDIIGGGWSKCVDLTTRLLSLYSVPHRVLDKLCYDIRIVNTNRRAKNTFETKPLQSVRVGLLDKDGKFPMYEVPFLFNP